MTSRVVVALLAITLAFGAFMAGFAVASRAAVRPALAPSGAGGYLGSGGVAEPPSIAVTGEGRVSLVPDTAEVILGVERQAPTAKDALAAAADAMGALLDALEAAGLARDAVSSSGFSLHPQYDYERKTATGEPRLVGFRVTNTVRARLAQVDQVGAVVDAAVAAGADRVEGVRFFVRDGEAAHHQALELAVKSARGRAETLARAAGVRLGRPIRVVEEAASGPVEQVRMARSLEAAAATEIPPGILELVLRVRVEYLID